MSSFVDAETLLVSALTPDVPDGVASVSTEVPADRPETFITVERTGGPSDRFQDYPQIAIQCWGPSRWEAEQLATWVKGWLYGTLQYHRHVTQLSVNGSYEFNDPDSQHHRWQVTCSFTTSAY